MTVILDAEYMRGVVKSIELDEIREAGEGPGIARPSVMQAKLGTGERDTVWAVDRGLDRHWKERQSLVSLHLVQALYKFAAQILRYSH